MLFSYQNLSPFLSIWNCWPRRQPNVGPTTAPESGLSARPPTTRSMSSWRLYTDSSSRMVSGSTVLLSSGKEEMVGRPQYSRTWL